MKEKFIPYLLFLLWLTWFVYIQVILIRALRFSAKGDLINARKFKRLWGKHGLLGFFMFGIISIALVYLHYWINS